MSTYQPNYPALALEQQLAAQAMLEHIEDLPQVYIERLQALVAVNPATITTQKQWMNRIDMLTLWPADLDSIVA